MREQIAWAFNFSCPLSPDLPVSPDSPALPDSPGSPVLLQVLACKHLPTELLATPGERAGMLTQVCFNKSSFSFKIDWNYVSGGRHAWGTRGQEKTGRGEENLTFWLVLWRWGGVYPYLIFVIFSPRALFLAKFVSTQKRVNCKNQFCNKTA